MKELVMSREEIEEACIRIGTSLNERLKNEERLPVFICVMKGAMNFMSDLIKHIESDILVDYIKIS
ncbi:MAG: hypoxanthine phosphoribosyltransferase, partial [Candidatus Enteromonas sp.]|nr:hypoxanthine phosphoribosyltransferase [Candidatus Enteromonas sp.]